MTADLAENGTTSDWLTQRPTSCDGCGLCCQGIGSPPLVYARRAGGRAATVLPPLPLPPHLQQELDEQFGGLYRGQEPQAACIWFDPQTRRCRHYDYRPEVCRAYELAGPECLRRRHDELVLLRTDSSDGANSHGVDIA